MRMILLSRLPALLAGGAAALSLGACAESSPLGSFSKRTMEETAKGGDSGYIPASHRQLAEEALSDEEIAKLNTQIVTRFYDMVFHDHRAAEAIALYGGATYHQHTPGAPSGWAALESYLTTHFKANPLARSEIKRVIAQGDLVVVHAHATDNPSDPGRAIVDIFRLEDGKIVEHWDVVEPIARGTEETQF
jgi:predicted SnoaL-like aldol condensation-catalyzing enzyme